MRKFDHEGLEIASFQAELFEASVTQTNTSSPIFLRRFFLSDYAYKMDNTPVELQAFVILEAFESLDKEYGHSSYGKEKYSSEAMFWLGYFTRYICYTREIPSRLLYRLFDIKKIYSLYTPFHTQSEEWCISRLLEQYGYTEATLNLNERLKTIMRKAYYREMPINR